MAEDGENVVDLNAHKQRINKDIYLARLQPYADPPSDFRAQLEGFLLTDAGKFMMASFERKATELTNDLASVDHTDPRSAIIASRIQSAVATLEEIQSTLIDTVNGEIE